MSAAPTQIGTYAVESELGRGGMGVVYLATDSRLGRKVAIKALPEHFATDPERLARFEREARTLAALNHPNVAGIHGVEEHDGRRYLVLEYIEGETLADRLDRGPLPVDEAIEVCAQIAAGLEAAHEAGVVHRDVKPANVRITSEGDVKVLDFGLARTEEATSSGSSVSQMPTLTTPHSPTQAGAILGTAPYMSPEQARGRKVDKRSDVWSFGVLLYECLTGMSPFVGETATDSIGAILHKDVDLNRLPPGTSAGVRRALSRCLERDKSMRYRDMGDVRIELLRKDEEGVALGASARSMPIGAIAVLVVAALALGAGGFAILGGGSAPVEVKPFIADIAPPEGMVLARRAGVMQFSPDGTKIAYIAFRDEVTQVLCVRDLETGQTLVFDGSEGASMPFWSTDGRWIAYFTGSRLERVDSRGGQPEHLAQLDANFGYSAAWGEDGRILLSSSRMPLVWLAPDTEAREIVLDPFPERAGDWPGFPVIIPGRDAIIFMNQDDETASSGVYVFDTKNSEMDRLYSFETTAAYAEPGWVLFWRAGDLHAQRFNSETLTIEGESERLAAGVMRQPWPAYAMFTVSGENVLAYLPSESNADETELVQFDRETGESTPLGVTGSLWNVAVSPDGRFLALDRTVDSTAGDIAVWDFSRGVETMLSRDRANESVPVWSEDGAYLYFFRGPDLFRVRSDATQAPEAVYSSEESKNPLAVTDDGQTLIFGNSSGDTQIMLLDLASRETTTWIKQTSDWTGFALSPDGAWAAHESVVGGEQRIFVRSFPEGANATLVSAGAGAEPEWVGDEIFYKDETAIYSVSAKMDESGALTLGTPQVVTSAANVRDYDVMPDGRTVILNQIRESDRGGVIRIVRNWTALLEGASQ